MSAPHPQTVAADPGVSAFVTANAGSGKTKTLVDRVARLLLHGARPEAILCVTYTKAAAAEMQRRLFDELGGWAVMADAPLAAFALLGLFAGAAAGCKIFGVPAAGLVLLTLALRPSRLTGLIAFAAAASLLGGGWYLRSYLISGDPFHPAGGPWFGRAARRPARGQGGRRRRR